MERVSGSLVYKTPETMGKLSVSSLDNNPSHQQLQPHPEQWQQRTTHNPLPRTTTLPLRDINKNREGFVSATNVVQLRILLPQDSACVVDVYVY